MSGVMASFQLIVYGCGSEFEIGKFKQVKNSEAWVKPKGGLWTSPVNSSRGWRDWCKCENFGNLEEFFTIAFSGCIYFIDCVDDLRRMPMMDGAYNSYRYKRYPDFERMVKEGIDAIWLTDKGEQETRFSDPSLYGWDCETVLIMNPDGILL